MGIESTSNESEMTHRRDKIGEKVKSLLGKLRRSQTDEKAATPLENSQEELNYVLAFPYDPADVRQLLIFHEQHHDESSEFTSNPPLMDDIPAIWRLDRLIHITSETVRRFVSNNDAVFQWVGPDGALRWEIISYETAYLPVLPTELLGLPNFILRTQPKPEKIPEVVNAFLGSGSVITDFPRNTKQGTLDCILTARDKATKELRHVGVTSNHVVRNSERVAIFKEHVPEAEEVSVVCRLAGMDVAVVKLPKIRDLECGVSDVCCGALSRGNFEESDVNLQACPSLRALSLLPRGKPIYKEGAVTGLTIGL